MCTTSFNPSLEVPGFLVFCFWLFLNVSLAVCGWAAACSLHFAGAAYGHPQAVGRLEAPLGVHAHLGVGLRRMSARRFICRTSALHNKHGGGAERLNKDKAHAARRFICGTSASHNKHDGGASCRFGLDGPAERSGRRRARDQQEASGLVSAVLAAG